MTEKSRTEYSARNTTVAMAARVIAILAGYFTRVIFTHTLSEDYVGVNGLFMDILNVLALSELGVGTAITFALYKPIARKDIERQKSLMRMYRSFYRVVAGIVLVCGLMVIPFMDVLMKNKPQVEHLIPIYLMYLFNSVLSYLLVYKKTLIDAYQQSYIGVLYHTFFLILQNGLQIAVLLLTHNFILFVSILVFCTVANNLCISAKADKMYPFLKEKQVQKLPKEEKKGIYQNVRAMLMHKIGDVIVGNTDNLLLSSLVGIGSVGCYSNYYLVIGSIRQVLNQAFQGITASVGNLGVEESKERIQRIFEASFFMGQWLFGLMTICLYELLDLFVEISFGSQFVFTKEITFILCLNFYVTGMRQATLVFRDSMGLFWYDRYKSIAEAVINLAVSILLGRRFGVLGIFIGTLVSTVTTSLWVEPYMLYKHRLQTSAAPYFRKYALYASITFLLWYAEDTICRRVQGNIWSVFVLRALICLVITNLVYLILYCRTREFQLLLRKARYILRKKLKREEKNFSQGKKDGFHAEEEVLLRMLGNAVGDAASENRAVKADNVQIRGTSRENFKEDKLITIAQSHEVLSFLYGMDLSNYVLCDGGEKFQREAQRAARGVTLQSYRMLFLCRYLVNQLEKKGIPVVVLKGVGTAGFYKEPELRKTGDVDLLLPEPAKLQEACCVLEKSGCYKDENQLALHHVVYRTPEGIEIELHTMLAEPFDNERINQYMESKLEECKAEIRRVEVMGVEFPVLSTGYHAYELLLHMLQHFLRSGFGLKLLCDWVVLWNTPCTEEEKRQYLQLVQESGLKGFSDLITEVCCTYLGLSEDRVSWMNFTESYNVQEFMREILEAEEFGKSSADRMVALRNGGTKEYFREFHHQMHLNFPRAGKYVLFWPALWLITLFRFLRNNRKIRKVTIGSVLKKASQRGRLLESIRLWEK